MKTTKVSRKIEILSTFLSLGLIINLLSGCDVLESDPDVLQPTVEIMGDEVYVLANGTSFIDLQSKVHTTLEARLAVTSSPTHGTITDFGKGMLQYSPTQGNSKARDGFEVTVYSKSNEILKKDTIVIIIETDSTKLPCSIYPVNDYVYNVSSAVTIDVTKNDIICSSDVTVSVYQPDNEYPPYYGKASVSGNKIVYTPDPSFTGVDKLMYKLTANNDPDLVAYGIAYITDSSSCQFAVQDDVYRYNTLQEGASINLSVFFNDSICEALNLHQVSISSDPAFGKATLTSDGILYQIPDSVGRVFNDHFSYEVCLDASCKTARVDIKLNLDSISTCSIYAAMDSIDISKNIEPLIYLSVLENDSLCDGLTAFEITKAPKYGIAVVSEANNTIKYQYGTNTEADDWLDYTICNQEKCSTTTVYIIRKN